MTNRKGSMESHFFIRTGVGLNKNLCHPCNENCLEGWICTNVTTVQGGGIKINRISKHKYQINLQPFPETFWATLLLTAVSIIIKANMSTAAIMSLLSATRTYLQIGCNDNNYFWLSCCLFHHRESGCVHGRPLWERGRPTLYLFSFSYLTGNPRQGCMLV